MDIFINASKVFVHTPNKRKRKRNGSSRKQRQVGRIRRILNRRNPIWPGNGMSSFPSVLSLPKIRGISAIKIRVFDYRRFSRSSSFLPSENFLFLPFRSTLFSLFRYSTGIRRRLLYMNLSESFNMRIETLNYITLHFLTARR